MANIGNTFSDLDEESRTNGSDIDDSAFPSQEHQLEPGKVSQGTFDGTDTYDYFEFQTVAGHAYNIVVTSDPLYGWLDFNSSTEFDFDIIDDGLFPTEYHSSFDGIDNLTQEVTFTADTTGTFYVRIDGENQHFDYGATISDLGVSTQPTALNDTYYIHVDGFSADPTIGLLNNDSDPDLDPLTVDGFNYGGTGTLQINPDGSFDYTPAPGFFGEDTFTYTTKDDNDETATATVTINVDPEPAFVLEIFNNCGHPTEGDTAFPGSILAIRPTDSFPGSATHYLAELGPIELLCRPAGTNDPFESVFQLFGDHNAIVVGQNLVGMEITAQARNGALFQTNTIEVSTQPTPSPDPTQSFGLPLVVPDENLPGTFNVYTIVDDVFGFGSIPSFCVEVEYLSAATGEKSTFVFDVNSLVTPNPAAGFNFSLEALNNAIQQEFDNIKKEGDKLVFEQQVPDDQTFYKLINFRFQKKYEDGNGDDKIVTTDYVELIREDDGSVTTLMNIKTIDFSSPIPPPTGPASVIGNGGEQGDFLIGSTNTNILNGAGGDDMLISRGVSDFLIGGSGNDDGVAGPGFTLFDGGADTDTYHLNGNFFDFVIVDGSTNGGFFNTHIFDTRPGNPLSKSVVLDVERIAFRDGVLNKDTGLFKAFRGFGSDGTPVTEATSFNGIVMGGQTLIDFEAFPPLPLELQQLEFFGQAALTESTDGVLVYNGHTYSIDPPFDAYLDLREVDGRIEVFVTDADYYNFAPPGTVDQSFSITVTNDQGSETYDFPFFIGRPDVAPVTDLGLSAVTVTENADAGTVVGAAQLTFVDDPDVEEDFLLQVSGADAALFEFDDAGNLVVADGASIDLETQQTANIIISATNLNGDVFEKAVEITIENMPISDITMVSGGTVREGAADDTVVATFESLENPVEPTAVLSIVSGGDGLFYLDGNELKVSPNAGAVFDFDDQSNYFITFSATDGTGPAYEESFDIFVENVGPILGTPDEDVLDGTGFNDEILALESDDVINASFGDDDIDGGPGTDTVVYARGRNQITHDWMNDGTIVVARTALGEGTDTLTNVERIDLDDGSLLYDVDTPNLGFGYRIYQASFDRTPDEGGVLFWIGVLDDLDNQGWSQYDKEQFLASQFIQSDEFKDLFGANPTNEEYIDAMYQNVLDRLPDQGGYDFWVGGMVNDGLTREDILIAFTKSDENVDRTAPDLDDGVWVV